MCTTSSYLLHAPLALKCSEEGQAFPDSCWRRESAKAEINITTSSLGLCHLPRILLCQIGQRTGKSNQLWQRQMILRVCAGSAGFKILCPECRGFRKITSNCRHLQRASRYPCSRQRSSYGAKLQTNRVRREHDQLCLAVSLGCCVKSSVT